MKIRKILLSWKWKMAREKAKQRSEKRERIAKLLTEPMSNEQIDNYNLQIVMNSAGWIGGNYTEERIKELIFSENRDLFKVDDYRKITKK